MKLPNHLSQIVIVLLATIALSGCATISHQYAGDLRNDKEVAKILRVSGVQRSNSKPDFILSSWKINGKEAKSDLSITRAWAVLPGKTEVGALLSLVRFLPITVQQFEGTYWVPFEAKAGKTYQLYAENKEGDLPLQVCALEVPDEIAPFELSEGMKLPNDVKLVGCGTPKNPVQSYELRTCSGIGTCPISDATLKP